MASEPASGSATSADVGQQEPQATLKRRSQEQMQTNAAEPRMKDYEFNLWNVILQHMQLENFIYF